MWEIDGGRGEGGGQILRVALALASLAGTPVRVYNIRARRPNPGLAASHLSTVEALAHLTQADVRGAVVGSTTLEYSPGPIRAGRLEIDIGTAGSTTLVLQACLPVALRAPGLVRMDLLGGTDVPWSPPADYVQRVFLPLVQRMGIGAKVEIKLRGYYPRGGGRLAVEVRPSPQWRPLVLDRCKGKPSIGGFVHVAGLPEHVPHRMRKALLQVLGIDGGPDLRVEVLAPERARGQGGAAVVWATFSNTVLGHGRVAERGVRAEDIGTALGADLKTDLDLGATVDPRAADQVLLYLALAEGPSVLRVRHLTNHFQTEVDLLRELLGARITVSEEGALLRVTVAPGELGNQSA